MAGNDLRHLSRAELVEIIYELKKRDEENRAALDELRARLDDRSLQISEAGSIAEAALRINRVFEAAQAAADQYLDAIRAENAGSAANRLIQAAEKRAAYAEQQAQDAERRAQEAERHADEVERYAEQVIADAQERAQRILEDADREVDEKWEQLRSQAEELLRAHEALSGIAAEEAPAGQNSGEADAGGENEYVQA